MNTSIYQCVSLARMLFFYSAMMLHDLAVCADPAPCLNNADDVVIRGVASKESDGKENEVWVLTTETLICIHELLDAKPVKKSRTYVNRIQILGVPPPAGMLIDLKGKLITGNFTNDFAVPNSISVVSSTKVHDTSDEVRNPSVTTETDHRHDVELNPHETANNDVLETTPETIPRNIIKALQLAKQAQPLFKVNLVELDIDESPGESGYSVYLRYSSEVFSGSLAGQEAKIAFDNNNNFATAFVKQLINIGEDPAIKMNPRAVSVCSEVDGLAADLKTPELQLIGCAQYSPDNALVDPDFKKIAGKLTTPP